ncbi:DUF2158 domain-containing protein [Microscilla marina]|nr:DUF2158 domain-containing protein [Microscilla marina]
MRKFKVGDKVQHLSGGPVMVVKEYEQALLSEQLTRSTSDEYIIGQWYDATEQKFAEQRFHQDTVQKLE